MLIKGGNHINELSVLSFLTAIAKVVVDVSGDNEQCCDTRVLAKVSLKQESKLCNNKVIKGSEVKIG